MTGFERDLSLKVFAQMMPLPHGVPRPEKAARVFLDRWLSAAPWPAVLGFRAAVWLLQLWPVFTGHFKPLTRLSPEKAEKVLDGLIHSRVYLVRQSCYLVRLQASVSFLGDLNTQHALGYRSPDWKPRGARENPYDPGELEAAGLTPEHGGMT